MLGEHGAVGGILDPGGYGQVPGEVKGGVRGDMDILVGTVEQEGAAIFAGDPGGAIDHSAGVAVARGVGGGGAAALVETIGRGEPRRRGPPDTYPRSHPIHDGLDFTRTQRPAVQAYLIDRTLEESIRIVTASLVTANIHGAGIGMEGPGHTGCTSRTAV